MGKNNLQYYLRRVLGQKFIPLVKKDRCELCYSTDNLEVHHDTQFIHMLEDTLELFNLKYQELDKYSEEELMLIRLTMFGMHLENKYLTLCDVCHKEIHKNKRKNSIIVSKFKKQRIQERQIDILKNYIENNIIDKKLFKNERNDFYNCLINLNHIVKNSHRSIGINNIKNMFKEFNIEYEINSYKDGSRKSDNFRKTYWLISRIDASESEVC